MIITPAQIRAARALLHLNRDELARRARVSNSTIRRLESPIQSTRVATETLDGVRHVLEQAGAEFALDGVRKRAAVPSDARSMFEDLRAISIRSAARLQDRDDLSAAALYDEDGLPA